MGKGSRNRVDREDENIFAKKTTKTKKRRARRPLPKLLIPIVSAVIVVALVVTAIMVSLMNNGTFKRTNILVKSQKNSKYSINQQTAQVLIWTSVWDQASDVYEYYGDSADSKFEYCWGLAMTAKYDIHRYIEDYYAQTFTSLVASCDEGIRSGVKFTKEEQQAAYDEMISDLKSQAYDYYSHLSEEGVSNISPYYVYYASYPYFGQYLKLTLGNDIKEKDIRRAAVIQAYANKVFVQRQNEYWEASAENIAAEVKANPEKYYSTEYLMYSTKDAALAAILKSTTTEAAFKTAIVTDYVKNNYVSLYNKYVTEKTAEVNETLAAVQNKTTGEELDAALTAQGMTKTDYTAATAEAGLVGDLHVIAHWLFPEDGTARAQYDATTLISENGLKAYVVVVSAVNGETVTAAYKEFAYETLSEENFAKLTNTVLKSLDISIAEDAAVYESASEKADAILADLTAAADKNAFLAAHSAINADGINNQSQETISEDIIDAVFYHDDVQSGSILKAGIKATFYVVFVRNFTPAVGFDPETGTAEVPASADISYIKTEEKMDNVVDDLASALESTVPKSTSEFFKKPAAVKAAELLAALNAAEDKTSYLRGEGGVTVPEMTDANHTEKSVPDEVSAAVLAEGVSAGAVLTVDKPNSTSKHLIYVSEITETGVSFTYLTVSTYETGSYLEWLFGNVNIEAMTGGAAAGETFQIDPAEGEESYRVYLTIGTPLSKDTKTVVRGGYVSFESTLEAEDALNSLSGLSNYKLLNTMAGLGTDAVTSDRIGESDVEGDLKNWLFSDDRTANEVAVIKVVSEEDGSSSFYVVAFVQKLEAWESSARTNYANDCVVDWMKEIVEENGYTVSEKALKRVKNPKPPASSSDTTAAE